MYTSKSKSPLRLVESTAPSVTEGATERLARSLPATGAYYRRIERYARKIRDADDVGVIIRILDEALSDTRALNDDSATRVLPSDLTRAERKIEDLKKELEQLRGLVHLDHLTGTLNRGGLDQAYLREAARADRGNAPLGTALLDIDDFKSFNDRHGHQAGDAALIHFAKVIKHTIRPSDVVVRFGGEEFLFLLPDSGAQQTASALCRLQNDLNRSPLWYQGRKLPMTFSAGIAVRKPGESRDSVIRRADRALYQAKSNGKNRAIFAD
jgi:diguanylate cyclase